MKVPLIATINHRTIDLRDKTLKVKIYRNGTTEVATSPYKPYYYLPDGDRPVPHFIRLLPYLNTITFL